MAKRNRPKTEPSNRTEPEPSNPTKRSASDIAVLIVCAIITATATVTAGILATHKQTTVEIREVPTFNLADVTKYFPLKKGNYWIYRGMVLETTTDGKVEQVPVTVPMKVTDVFRSPTNPEVVMFTMQGHPNDALDPDSPLSEYSYVIVSNKVLQVQDIDQAKDAILKDAKLAADPASSAITIAFEFPLFKGQRFGDIDQITRGDLSYFRYVELETQYDEPKHGSIQRIRVFKINSNTLPDSESIWFEPYLGITEYKYVHHGGTTKEVELKLQDYNVDP